MAAIQEEYKHVIGTTFDTTKKSKLGPGEYDSQLSQTNNDRPTWTLDPNIVGEMQKAALKDRLTTKFFDGSGATIKNIRPIVKLAIFEERYEADPFDTNCKVNQSVFNSEVEKLSSIKKETSPGPCFYDIDHKPIKEAIQTPFGSKSIRDDMTFRNIN